MHTSRVLSRWAAATLVSGVMLCTTGCQAVTAVGNYFLYRYQDFTEIAEIGVTITATPQVGLYWNSLEVLVAGFSDVDGWFVGLGGGQIGVTRHYNNCYGLGYAIERTGWGSGLDSDNREACIGQREAGILGMLADMIDAPFDSPPDYTFS